MTDNINQKNLKLEEEEEHNKDESKKLFAFLDESEIIINQIIEKIISLVITNSTNNRIEKMIPGYCFDEIQQIFKELTHLDFLTYDKDDLEGKVKIPYEKIKSATNRIKENSLFLKEADNDSLNSETIRNYKFEKNFDPKTVEKCSLNLDVFDDAKTEKSEKIVEEKKERIVMGILTREGHENNVITSFEQEEKKKIFSENNGNFNYNLEDKGKIIKQNNEENDPFKVNPDEKIDTIKNVENHKIEILSPVKNEHKKAKIEIPFDIIVDSNNFWGSLSQPLAPPIDRDAGTKIKYEKPKNIHPYKRKQTILVERPIIEEQKNSKKKTINVPKKRPKLNYSNRKNPNDENKNKKKKYVQIEFESTDIDPKYYETYIEANEIGDLRLKVEKELQEKKIELQKIAQKEREKQAKLEEIEELRKELSKKDITVDIKGEIVYIKPIDIKTLNEEFNTGRSNTKIIKTVETESNYIKNKKNAIIEKNPEINAFSTKEEKSKKKSKKKRENMLMQKNYSAVKKAEQKPVIDKDSMRFAAGSNFTIMNPEVGVTITEDKKRKSGGKDFYQKYNRFSLEIFQDQLSKTATSNFFPTITQTIPVNNDKVKKRVSISKKEKLIKDIEKKILEGRQNNEDNNMLSLKTKNLRVALQKLDLVTEGEESTLSNNKKLINKNIIKNALNKYNKAKSDYREMNIFAKTLMGSNNWGGNINYDENKNDILYKIPKKPEMNELQRELPLNLLKHMPRKRLPPIVNTLKLGNMGKTISGFYTNRRPKKVKWLIEDNNKNIKTDRDN